jgi:phosphatidylserine decarboxylase
MTLGALMRKRFFSALVGAWMKSRWSRGLIGRFVRTYGIDLREARDDNFRSFDEFFRRPLAKGARPFPQAMDGVGFPVDGRHLAFPNIREGDVFFAKGSAIDLKTLLQSEELGRNFEGGALVISRLSPVDYHRFHFPYDGIPSDTRSIDGYLYSVHPLVLRRKFDIFFQNKRFLTLLHHPNCGQIALVEVGATGVGSVRQTFRPHLPVRKGDEKGYFHFGGSTVITLFRRNCVRLCEDLVYQSRLGYETLAPCGDTMGYIVPR